ncbi:hypothetical protein DFQ27_006699 [Actinomortierella ambigua]|uniref:Uncharacterized protein n=1 Tax=Actinomortierella ambigua TaxID=1343610 RepID=A0A9P6QK13_9FUNG|nr:hypothetical protein DFQ27_006699 [Actinomortierella ambigua]
MPNGAAEGAPTVEQQAAAARKIQAAIRAYNARRDLFAGPILTDLQKWNYLCLYARLNARGTPATATATDAAAAAAATATDIACAMQDDARQGDSESANDPQDKHARLWTRMMFLTSQLGKGSSTAPSEEALVLLTEHWLEMSDKKHRYGSNLKPYHERWLRETTSEDFFDWLDNGSGRDLSLEERPRSRLETELVQYLQEHEREQYAVTAKDGLLYYRDSGDLVHTLPDTVRAEDEVDLSQVLPDADVNDDEATRLEKKRLRNRAKYIYVMDPKGVLYIGRKIKGNFHHSSFFGGGTVCAAGGIVVNHGRLMKVNPKSGHYRPGQMHFDRLLRTLREMGVPLDNVKISTSIFERRK